MVVWLQIHIPGKIRHKHISVFLQIVHPYSISWWNPWSLCKSSSSEIRTCPLALSWLWGPCSPSWITSPSHDTKGKNLVLPQVDCHVLFEPWEACPFLKGGGGGVDGEVWKETGEEEGEEIVVTILKLKKSYLNKIKNLRDHLNLQINFKSI